MNDTKYNDLLNSLISITPDAQWTEEDLFEKNGPDTVLKRVCFDILNSFLDFFDFESGYIAITGFKAGYFVPIAAIGRNINEIDPVPSTRDSQQKYSISNSLHSTNASSRIHALLNSS